MDRFENKNVAVIIATYNGEKYIAEQLSSIVSQTRKPDLIVISDGMSTDKTVQICKVVLESQKTIKYKIITNDRRLSVVDNFQIALNECDCGYVFFSDQDDVWDRKKIRIVVDGMEEHHALLAFTNANIVGSNLEKLGESSLWDAIGYTPSKGLMVYQKGDSDFLLTLIKHNVVTGMCMCIDAELKKTILPLSRYGMHDGWIAAIAINMGKILSLDMILVSYRQHGYNQIGTKKSLKRTLSNSRKYVEEVRRRNTMICELMTRVWQDASVENISLIKNYKMFLEKRNSYFNGAGSLFAPIKLRKDYKRFEYKPYQIMVKDFICRFSMLVGVDIRR